MKNSLNESEKVLSAKELKASLPYACYDRTMFHYFERINHFSKFKQLFMDRYLGFDYSDLNEPILPLVDNGLDLIKSKFEKNFEIILSELPEQLHQWLREGYMAHAMLITERNDGSTYITSNLIESISENTAYLTKTNGTMIKLCVPTSMENLSKKFLVDAKGKGEITFIKVSETWLEKMKNMTFENLFDTLLRDEYNYQVRFGNLYHNEHEVQPSNAALEQLVKYFEATKDEILTKGIDKRNQLRMYKHIANKIEPILNCWEEILKEYELTTDMQNTILEIRNDLNNILKWFSLLYNRTNKQFYDKYLNSLRELLQDYSTFQTEVHLFVIKKMEIK